MSATFTVETGTGSSSANAYVSVADADQYNLDNSADATWVAASDADKQKAIRLATQYMDNVYYARWLGSPTNEDQALNWPRYDVPKNVSWTYDDDEMPELLKDACAELAIISAGGTTLLPNQTAATDVMEEKLKVDVIEISTKYAGGNSPFTLFSTADSLLKPLINASGRVTRA